MTPLLANAVIRRIIRLFYPALMVLILIWLLCRTALLKSTSDRLDTLIDHYGFPPEAREYSHIGQSYRDLGFGSLFLDIVRLMLRTPWVFFIPLNAPTWTRAYSYLLHPRPRSHSHRSVHHELVGSMVLFAVTPLMLTYRRFGLCALLVATFVSSTVAKDDNVNIDCFLGGLALCHIHHQGTADATLPPQLSSRAWAAMKTALRSVTLLILSVFVVMVWTTTNRGALAVQASAVHPWREAFLDFPVLVWFNPIAAETWAAVAFIYLVEHVRALQWLFSSMPFVALGKMSFTLYLVHGFVFTFIGSWLLPVVLPGSSSLQPDVVIDVGLYRRAIWLFNLPISLVVVMPASTLLCHVIDLPSIGLGRWVVAKLNAEDVTGIGIGREVLRDFYEATCSLMRAMRGGADQIAVKLSWGTRVGGNDGEAVYEALPLHDGRASPSAFLEKSEIYPDSESSLADDHLPQLGVYSPGRGERLVEHLVRLLPGTVAASGKENADTQRLDVGV